MQWLPELTSNPTQGGGSAMPKKWVHLKRRDTGRQLRWGVEPHLHKIKSNKKTKHPPKIVPQRHTQRTRTDKQAFTQTEKTLQCQKGRHSQHAQKHYNIDRNKWRQIEEAPNQSHPRKVTHKHYGGTKVAGGILCLPWTTTVSPRRASKGDGLFAGRWHPL